MPASAASLALAFALLLQSPPAPDEDGLPLAGSLEEGRQRAAADHRVVLLAFRNAMSEPSLEMDKDLLSDRRLADLRGQLVLVRADPLDGAEGSELARRYNVHALPTLVLLEPDGSEIERLEDALGPAALRRVLDDDLARKGPLARLRARAKEKPDDMDNLLQLGRELMSRGDEATARTCLQQVASRDVEHKAPQWGARALYDLGLLALRGEKVDEARKAFDMVAQGYPASLWAADAVMAVAQVLQIDGQTAEAVRELEKFRVAHPGHPRDPQVVELLERLRASR